MAGYAAKLIDLSPAASFAVKVAVVIVFSIVNIIGLDWLEKTETFFTVLVVAAFAAVAIVGLCNWQFNPFEPIFNEEEGLFSSIGNGIAISEFPTTMEAARHASENGMLVLMGAPNVVRGGSHSGNISALEIAQAGYLGSLSSDYVPVSLLEAAFALSEGGYMSLPAAVGLVTANPAEAVGLADRGSLEVGRRADLVRVSMVEGQPVVRNVWREGAEVF